MSEKLSEEEIKELVAAAQERRKKIIDLRRAALEGHLLVEEALNALLEACLFNPELKLNRTNFHMKGELAVSLAAGRGRDEMWAVFWAINQLRNEMAHNLDSEDIDKKMVYLRKTYIAVLEPAAAAHAQTQTDKQIVDDACSVCAGFLGQLASEAQARRAIIDEYWESP